jgi:glycosyltransferase involved in cell wall biosynthesis
MRILHVIPTYVPAYRYGGPVRSVHGLAEAQAAAGDEVAVFTTDVDGPGRLEVPLAVPVAVGRHVARYFPVASPRRLMRSPAMRPALARELPGRDLVHLHSVFLWPTLAAARAALRAGIPYVVSPRGMLDPELVRRRGALRKRLWIALFERRTLAGAARIVATSAQEAELLAASAWRSRPWPWCRTASIRRSSPRRRRAPSRRRCAPRWWAGPTCSSSAASPGRRTSTASSPRSRACRGRA